jgi:hypothetical protein
MSTLTAARTYSPYSRTAQIHARQTSYQHLFDVELPIGMPVRHRHNVAPLNAFRDVDKVA